MKFGFCNRMHFITMLIIIISFDMKGKYCTLYMYLEYHATIFILVGILAFHCIIENKAFDRKSAILSLPRFCESHLLHYTNWYHNRLSFSLTKMFQNIHKYQQTFKGEHCVENSVSSETRLSSLTNVYAGQRSSDLFLFVTP